MKILFFLFGYLVIGFIFFFAMIVIGKALKLGLFADGYAGKIDGTVGVILVTFWPLLLPIYLIAGFFHFLSWFCGLIIKQE